jgi:hypothetical protein
VLLIWTGPLLGSASIAAIVSCSLTCDNHHSRPSTRRVNRYLTMRVHESVMMESEPSLVDIVERLKRVQELLESEGWHVKANSVALAIAALKERGDKSRPYNTDAKRKIRLGCARA